MQHKAHQQSQAYLFIPHIPKLAATIIMNTQKLTSATISD
jgi:hypothetical protein